jgi:hypothetical protein
VATPLPAWRKLFNILTGPCGSYWKNEFYTRDRGQRKSEGESASRSAGKTEGAGAIPPTRRSRALENARAVCPRHPRAIGFRLLF